MIYLIWSYKRNAWWRAASAGYTRDVAQAGQYDAAEAVSITGHYGPTYPDRSVMIEASLVYAMFEQDAEHRK